MPEATVANILLACEDVLRRDGVAGVLRQSREIDCRVVCSVSDSRDALLRIRELQPGIAIVETDLPGMGAAELIRSVRGEHLPTRFVVLADSGDAPALAALAEAGADAYLLKNASAHQLLQAVACVLRGGQFFPPLHDARSARPARRGRVRAIARRPAPAVGVEQVLERLDEMDLRISHMETGEEPLPPHAEISSLVEDAVNQRFHAMAGRLRQDIEQTHVQAVEAFVQNVQTRLVQRVSALERDITMQAEAMNQLQEYSRRTEDNLGRLLSGVDKLTHELPRQLDAPERGESLGDAAVLQIGEVENHAPPRAPFVRKRLRRKGPSKVKWLWSAAATLVLLASAGLLVKLLNARTDTRSEMQTASNAASASPSAAPAATNPDRMQAAKEFMDRKEYPRAEALYRQVSQSEPSNAEALQGLASALYREDKLEEAAGILDKLPKN